jgi:anti-sigma B factor antagonist
MQEPHAGGGSVGITDDYRITVLLRADEVIVVRASGGIDVIGSVDFRERLFALLDEHAAQMLVDLSDARYVDTFALSVLVDVAIRCRLEHRRLAIICSEGAMRRALAATGLDQFVATYATLDEALDHGEPAS